MKAPSNQPNLISEQRALLKKIYSQGENLWKVLIFDNFNRHINSSLFKMKDLRESNITLYFNIKDNREQLHGVTAIYLVQPTKDNLDLITQDFEEDLYSSVVIHFSSEPQAHIMSTFAKNLAKNKPASLTKISRVEYSCLGFHTLGRNLAVTENNNEIINLISVLKYLWPDTGTSPSSSTAAGRSSRSPSSGNGCWRARPSGKRASWSAINSPITLSSSTTAKPTTSRCSTTPSPTPASSSLSTDSPLAARRS
jgi:hypothetical protein